MISKRAFLLGGIFLGVQILTLFRNYYSDYFLFFWFCDFAPMLFAFAFFTDNKHFAKGIINVGLFAQMIYLSLFIYRLASGVTLYSIAPESTNLFYNVSSIILHSSTFFAVLLTYRTKPTRKTLLYSLLILFGMYITTLLFTNPEYGINYVYNSRALLPFTIPYYVYLWIPITFAVVVLPTQLIQYWIYKIFNSRKN